MGRAKRLFIIGLMVMALPHLGFVGMIENIIYFTFGLIIFISAYGIYMEKKNNSEKISQVVEPKIEIKKTATRTRAPRKIPSPYLPPIATIPPPLETNGFVFVKKREDKAHS